jgi:hypothetical protein
MNGALGQTRASGRLMYSLSPRGGGAYRRNISPRPLAPRDVRRVQPHRSEPIPPIRHAHIDELPGPAGRLGVDVLLTVVLPHDAGCD